MRCYFAMAGALAFSGGWLMCLNWGVERVKEDPPSVVKIILVRAGVRQGRVVAEITSDGMRYIENGRYIPRKKLGV